MLSVDVEVCVFVQKKNKVKQFFCVFFDENERECSMFCCVRGDIVQTVCNLLKTETYYHKA